MCEESDWPSVDWPPVDDDMMMIIIRTHKFMCIVKFILKMPVPQEAKSHLLHFYFSPLCVFKCVLKNLPEKSQSYIGCICLTCLHCALTNVSSSDLPEKMQSRIGCISLTFLHCSFLSVSLKRLNNRMQSHIGCICLVFLQCAFSNLSLNCLPVRMQSHIGCICLAFSHCEF